MGRREVNGVLITGVYGSGKSSVTAELAYLLEQRHQPYALLDLDYLSWAGTADSDGAEEFGLLLQNLADVAANYRRAGICRFVLAYFVRDRAEVQALRQTCQCRLPAFRFRWLKSNGAWPPTSPADGAMISGKQRHRSRPVKERA